MRLSCNEVETLLEESDSDRLTVQVKIADVTIRDEYAG